MIGSQSAVGQMLGFSAFARVHHADANAPKPATEWYPQPRLPDRLGQPLVSGKPEILSLMTGPRRGAELFESCRGDRNTSGFEK